LLCFGVRTSSAFNGVIVAIKLAIILLVIIAGLSYIHGGNYSPFIPPTGTHPAPGGSSSATLLQEMGAAPGAFGVGGIFAGAALVFFAFIGFDIVATAAEETKEPQRDLPRGIIGSLVICTTLYVLVSLVVTGMVRYDKLNIDAPLAEAFKSVGHNGIATVITIGALAGLTTVTMILLLGQSRVLFAMSRDHLLPAPLARVNRFGTPGRLTLVVGVVVALMAGFIPLTALAELVNIGTLFAFIVVSIGVVVLRRTRPDLPRAFRTPGVPVVPILSVLASLWLMLNLPVETWVRFAVWMAVGLVVYALYGRRHSRVTDASAAEERRERTAAEPRV
jgi:APA family basic amino acid/polyamine antiporter